MRSWHVSLLSAAMVAVAQPARAQAPTCALRALDSTSTVTIGGRTFKAGVDFIADAYGPVRQLRDVPTIWGATAFDTTNLLTESQVAGKAIVMRQKRGGSPVAWLATDAGKTYKAVLAKAVTIAYVQSSDTLNPRGVAAALHPTRPITLRSAESAPEFTISARLAEAIFGRPDPTVEKGAAGQSLTSDVRFRDEPASCPGGGPK